MFFFFLFFTIIIECLTFFVLSQGIMISNYNLFWIAIVNNKIDISELYPYSKVKKENI